MTTHSAGSVAPSENEGLQHCCHTPGVPLTGRQCHIQPDANLSTPVCSVLNPYFERVVSFFVASFANVVMMSVAWHTQSSPVSRYGAEVAHSAHAPSLVGSGWPAPLGSCPRRPKRSAASVLEASAKARRIATFADCITRGVSSISKNAPRQKDL